MNQTTQLMTWKIAAGEKSPLQLVDPQYQASTLDQLSQILPMGVYTTFRTFDRVRALCLDDHFSRLEESARLVHKPIQLERSRLRRVIREALEKFTEGEAQIRVTLDLQDEPGAVYITLEPLRLLSPDQYRDGVRVITRPIKRRNPRAKLSRFIREADRFRQEMPEGVEEIIMVDDQGRMAEGLSSNIFLVEKGVIWTAGKGVLQGITRALVLEAAVRAGIPVHFEARTRASLVEVEEAFITSSTRGVLPVIVIDEQKIGSGAPGRVTHCLAEGYQHEIQQRLEQI
ncbi:MAG: aminotransferase class IV [Chloroflexi bacterium]|nr:aminotransferase class IV [Chloroflexota bacterium]